MQFAFMNMHLVYKILALALALIVLALGSSATSNATGLSIERRTLDEQIALILNHTDIRIPENAESPVPTLIMFHGCGGLRDVQEDYARAALESGYGVMIVDSLSARNIGRFGALSQVCAALRLWGQERSADIHAALAIAAHDNRIDADNLALIGWSHGGWTVLDALGYSGDNVLPPALSEGDARLPDRVKAAILIYPYCGFPVRAKGSELDPAIPVHAILAEHDLIAPNRDCRHTLQRAREAGVTVDMEVWPGITHAFDEPNQPVDPRMEYNADAAARARAHIVNILDQTFTDTG